MARKPKPSRMTKVVPIKMDDALYERLQAVSEKVGEADSTVIRLVLRAGLKEIEKANYELFSFSDDFSAKTKSPKEKRAKGQKDVLCPGENEMPGVKNVPMGPVIVSDKPTPSVRELGPVPTIEIPTQRIHRTP